VRAGYRGTTLALSVAMVVLGVVALVRTAAGAGASPALGYAIGVALVAAGALRLWLLARTG
jgi:uncharacterized membrane protein HdeD (DUF308 family)